MEKLFFSYSFLNDVEKIAHYLNYNRLLGNI